MSRSGPFGMLEASNLVADQEHPIPSFGSLFLGNTTEMKTTSSEESRLLELRTEILNSVNVEFNRMESVLREENNLLRATMADLIFAFNQLTTELKLSRAISPNNVVPLFGTHGMPNRAPMLPPPMMGFHGPRFPVPEPFPRVRRQSVFDPRPRGDGRARGSAI